MALFTNHKGEPSIGHEIAAELESADGVDLLCAFIKWQGVRMLKPHLDALASRGVPLRVITTTYMGATQRRAIDWLVKEFGAEVRISYDTKGTRLHAKAWLFRRETGYDTGFVGSSNLSVPALLDGVEWNVRISRGATPTLIERFESTFEHYWNSPQYVAYDPDNEADVAQLEAALVEAGGSTSGSLPLQFAHLDVRPYPHQSLILEQLNAEREIHQRHQNLVVAATGTGKTVIAALDYRNLCLDQRPRPRLLFIAHRKEILEQARYTYRQVLADGNFGELLVGGEVPVEWDHVFASVASLKNRLQELDPARFEVVVLDECHHAEAATYQRLLEWARPRELLGLTATPERADGADIRTWFGGRIASEIRLWDALSAELLCPFHYFGVSDTVDLSALTWQRGGYRSDELDKVYTGNDARTRIILKALENYVGDVSGMRALGFCVSVAHAEYMARAFNEAGIPSVALHGGSSLEARAKVRTDLASRSINAVFTVDLFNEGVDIPQVDTVLFLRPTESATVFLQQLGRGLRKSEGKAVLTVLDFVGQQRREFRFDLRFSALTGVSRRDLEEAIEGGFPYLPSGCQIQLEREATRVILDNLKAQVAAGWKGIVREAQNLRPRSLVDFLSVTSLDLSELASKQRPTRSWVALQRSIGTDIANGPHEKELLKRAAMFAKVDDPERADAYWSLLRDLPSYDSLNPKQQRYARMLAASIWPGNTAPGGGRFAAWEDPLEILRREPGVREELQSVMECSMDASRRSPRPVCGGRFGLFSHASYTREEVAAAIGHVTLDRAANSLRQGVVYVPEERVDALFVTLNKTGGHFSPTTRYRDYALTRDLFHWESQSTTTQASPTGQRYVNQSLEGNDILLFVREQKMNEYGVGAAYTCVGNVDYVQHEGEKPISILWKLRRSMPEDLFLVAATAAD